MNTMIIKWHWPQSSFMMSIESYKTLVFDCDGVVLNSNKVKTRAFFQAAMPYGEAAAQALVDYHVSHGGISRYKKFALFLDQLVPQYAPEADGPNLEQLLDSYAKYVRECLLSCEIAEGLEELRQRTKNTKWLIVSGGDQSELREVFAKRGLDKLFNGGIFGSPDTKDEILAREITSNNIQTPALFLGDSKYDYQAATTAGLDFVFLSEWSEVKDWREWTKAEHVGIRNSLQEFLVENE